MSRLDPRLHAYRPDLADAALRGKVEATHFVTPTIMQIAVDVAPLRARPSETAAQETQALAGERVHVFDIAHDWLWVQLLHDGYVGYIKAGEATGRIEVMTHKVRVPLTLTFPEASIKSTPVRHLPLNAEVAVAQIDGKFARLSDGRHAIASHLSPLESQLQDYVAIAEQFLGVPYLWGGKTFIGLDCSGLVQASLHAAGIHCPRDADMQEEELGSRVKTVQRGDLIFWKGHVGIMCDATTLLHANGHHMMVVKEPLADAITRISAAGSEVTAMKRFQ
jgi:cell wall-associated NlpC family hydrolase